MCPDDYFITFNGKNYSLGESQAHSLVCDWFRTGEPLHHNGHCWRRENNLFFRNQSRSDQIQQFTQELFAEFALPVPPSLLVQFAEEDRINRAFFPIPCIARVAASILGGVQKTVDGMREFFADCFARLFGRAHPGPLCLDREFTNIPDHQYAPLLIAHVWNKTQCSGPFFRTVMSWLTFGNETRVPVQIQHLYDDHVQFRFLEHGWNKSRWGAPASQWKRMCQMALKNHDGYVTLKEKTYNLRSEFDYTEFLYDFACKATPNDGYLWRELYWSLPNYSEVVPLHFQQTPITLTSFYQRDMEDEISQLSITTDRERSFLQALPDRIRAFLGGYPPNWRGPWKLLLPEDSQSAAETIGSFCQLVLQRHAGLVRVGENGDGVCDIGTQEGYELFIQRLMGLDGGWDAVPDFPFPKLPSYEEAIPLRFRR